MQTSLATHRRLDLKIPYKATEVLGTFLKSNAKPPPAAVFGPTFQAEDAAQIILAQATAVGRRYTICPDTGEGGGKREEEGREKGKRRGEKGGRGEERGRKKKRGV